MSTRPGSPIGERVRKRRRGHGHDAEDEPRPAPQTESNNTDNSTPAAATTYTPPGSPASDLTTPPSTPSAGPVTPALSCTSTASDASAVRTPPPYVPPSPISPSPRTRAEKTSVHGDIHSPLAVGTAALAPSPVIRVSGPATSTNSDDPVLAPVHAGQTIVLPTATVVVGSAGNQQVVPVPVSTEAAASPSAAFTVAPVPINQPHVATTTAVAADPPTAAAPSPVTPAALIPDVVATSTTGEQPTLIQPVAAPAAPEVATAGAVENNAATDAAPTAPVALVPTAPVAPATPAASAAPVALAAPVGPVALPPPVVAAAPVTFGPPAGPHGPPVPAQNIVGQPGNNPLHNPVQLGPPAAHPPVPIPFGTAPLAPAIPQLLPGFEDVPGVIQGVVLNVANASSPADHVYGLSTIPRHLDWGKGRLERRLVEGTSTVYVRYPGRVRTTWFFGRSGEPQSRVNVGVNLMYDTHEHAMDVLFKKAKPPAAVPEVVFASRLQGQRQRGSFTEMVVPFKNVFDARDGVLAKTEDRRINAVDFTDNDVIVVEAELTRWKKSGSSGWSAFDVGFDLAAIFLLWDSS